MDLQNKIELSSQNITNMDTIMKFNIKKDQITQIKNQKETKQAITKNNQNRQHNKVLQNTNDSNTDQNLTKEPYLLVQWTRYQKIKLLAFVEAFQQAVNNLVEKQPKSMERAQYTINGNVHFEGVLLKQFIGTQKTIDQCYWKLFDFKKRILSNNNWRYKIQFLKEQLNISQIQYELIKQIAQQFISKYYFQKFTKISRHRNIIFAYKNQNNQINIARKVINDFKPIHIATQIKQIQENKGKKKVYVLDKKIQLDLCFFIE